ncbi:hypothetical protein SISNIDRAFT_449137 [Sistotremastrum niveocremeum HHB9708]|uniref:Uncharacterized protein n=1 Tax=Sistotremastrum niveocremeum HHB9708 TaxID=1314777 RepID=A0A164Z6I3_9AGAM|nr:hypothetical protein SISNIDRAFT_449137 [Sistotremastrum niveocremeum HHB9708]
MSCCPLPCLPVLTSTLSSLPLPAPSQQLMDTPDVGVSDPAPPPYSTGHEFDLKTAQAIHNSRQDPTFHSAHQPSQRERWDSQSTQSASLRSSQSAQSSSRPAARRALPPPPVGGATLLSSPPPATQRAPGFNSRAVRQSIVKGPRRSRPAEDPPDWYADTRAPGSPTPTMSSTLSSDLSTSESHSRPLRHARSRSSSFTLESSLEALDLAEDEGMGPPPFAAVGPSLDGPRYDEVVRESRWNRRRTSYSHESPPPSPLVDYPPESVRSRPMSTSQNTYGHPPIQRLPARVSSRPPTMQFDPAVAYKSFFAQEREQMSNPSSLYNSTVSSLMSNTARPSQSNNYAYSTQSSRLSTYQPNGLSPYSSSIAAAQTHLSPGTPQPSMPRGHSPIPPRPPGAMAPAHTQSLYNHSFTVGGTSYGPAR